MIGNIDIGINSAHPNIALKPVCAFVNSPSNLRILNVPEKIGNWEIKSVQVVFNYPDNTLKTADCVCVNGKWIATLAGCNVVGKSQNGYAVIANGTDENGNQVLGFVLGKGDITVLDSDGTITVGETTYYLHLKDSVPESPNKGDVAEMSGELKLYNGSEWVCFYDESKPKESVTLKDRNLSIDWDCYAFNGRFTMSAEVETLSAITITANEMRK